MCGYAVERSVYSLSHRIHLTQTNMLSLSLQVLMVDTKTGKPLPFGTLGIHKVI